MSQLVARLRSRVRKVNPSLPIFFKKREFKQSYLDSKNRLTKANSLDSELSSCHGLTHKSGFKIIIITTYLYVDLS
jgi:hypothetical protein